MKRVSWIFRLLVCLALIPLSASAQVNPKEYQIKAAFIYNFVKFVEWPGDLAISKQSNVNICVIGNDPFDEAGQQIFQHASTSALRLTLVQRKIDNMAGCHIVFISRSEEARLSDILSVLKNKPVLTISDINDFAQHGGVIGFATDDNKIKLVVNTAAASAAGLRIDAQLLEIALQVIRE